MLSLVMIVNLVFLVLVIYQYKTVAQITQSVYKRRTIDLAAWSVMAFDVFQDVSSQVACGGICSAQRATE